MKQSNLLKKVYNSNLFHSISKIYHQMYSSNSEHCLHYIVHDENDPHNMSIFHTHFSGTHTHSHYHTLFDTHLALAYSGNLLISYAYKVFNHRNFVTDNINSHSSPRVTSSRKSQCTYNYN